MGGTRHLTNYHTNTCTLTVEGHIVLGKLLRGGYNLARELWGGEGSRGNGG